MKEAGGGLSRSRLGFLVLDITDCKKGFGCWFLFGAHGEACRTLRSVPEGTAKAYDARLQQILASESSRSASNGSRFNAHPVQVIGNASL